jgi:hypothetical protein
MELAEAIPSFAWAAYPLQDSARSRVRKNLFPSSINPKAAIILPH